jgi:hypothetical protein
MGKLQMPRGYTLLNEHKIGTGCINRSVSGLWRDTLGSSVDAVVVSTELSAIAYTILRFDD